MKDFTRNEEFIKEKLMEIIGHKYIKNETYIKINQTKEFIH